MGTGGAAMFSEEVSRASGKLDPRPDIFKPEIRLTTNNNRIYVELYVWLCLDARRYVHTPQTSGRKILKLYLNCVSTFFFQARAGVASKA